MLAAPASIAATPTPRSRECWNPAVPPPPVGGAAVGNGLGDGLGDTDGVGLIVGLGDRLGDGLGDIEGETLAEGLVLGLVELLLDVVGVVEALVPDEDVGSAPDGALPEQAEIAMEANMASTPQPTAVKRALDLVPEVAARPFTEPPHASGRRRSGFPVPHPRNRQGP